MVRGMCNWTYDNHWDKSGNDKAKIDLHVGEHDEPAVTVTMLQLAGVLSTRNRSGGIFASDADTDEKAICS